MVRDEAGSVASRELSGGVWCPFDAEGAWRLKLVQYGLGLGLLSLLLGMYPARLKAADACVLLIVPR